MSGSDDNGDEGGSDYTTPCSDEEDEILHHLTATVQSTTTGVSSSTTGGEMGGGSKYNDTATNDTGDEEEREETNATGLDAGAELGDAAGRDECPSSFPGIPSNGEEDGSTSAEGSKRMSASEVILSDDSGSGTPKRMEEGKEWAMLRGLVADVRSRMQQCHLPPLDVAVIERFILQVVEKNDKDDHSPGTAISVSRSSTRCGIPRPPRRAPSQGLYGRGLYGRLALSKTPVPVAQFRAHSRHAERYNSVYGSLQAPTVMGTTRRYSAMNESGVKPHGSGSDPYDGRAESAASCVPLVFVGYGSNHGGKGVSSDMYRDVDLPTMFTPGVMEVMCLDKILRRHERSIVVTLAAIDRREIVMERLRAFLVITAKDLSIPSAIVCAVGSGYDGHNPDGSGGLPRTMDKGLRRCSATAPLRSYMDVNDVSWASFCAKAARKCSSRIGGGRRGSGVQSHRAFLHPWQRYYKFGVLHLLYRLQQVSLEVVEGIRAWRNTLTAPFPFVTKGHNYLLAMAQSVAELANDPVMHFLFPPPPARREKPGDRTPKPGISYKFSEPDPSSLVLPMCLQHYPLLSNLPQLSYYRQPPVGMVGINTPFDFGAPAAVGVERDATAWHGHAGALVVHQGRIRPSSGYQAPVDVSYARRLSRAERVVHSEVRVQLRLIEWELTLCLRGCYPLLLRNVGQTEVVYLRSAKRQEEWYFHLRDKLICLEEGSSAVVRG